jgi:hypothetical protein
MPGLFARFFGPPSKDKFAKLVMDGIRKAGETGKVLYDPVEFVVHAEDSKGVRLFLGNAYQEYCAVPKANRPKILNAYVRGWFLASRRELPDEFEALAPDLLPSVRSRSYYELERLRSQCTGSGVKNVPYQAIGDELAVGLVYDFSDSMQYINQEDLDKWGVTFYVALESARQNLQEREHSFIGPAEGEGVYVSAAQDDYDASRLVLLDLIQKLPVKGDPIAMVPNRGTLIVSGADDLDSLPAVLAMAKDSLKEPRSTTGAVLRLDGDDWVPWLPPQDHPLHEEFRMLRFQTTAQDYGEQKRLLDLLHERTGEDVFVASYTAMQNKETGRTTTYCVWSPVPSLLPRTDLIAFVQENEKPVLASWEEVARVAGHLMEPLDMYPERYRVGVFPGPEQLAAMEVVEL